MIDLKAGKRAPAERLIDVAELERKYYDRRPDVNDPNQLFQNWVKVGTDTDIL